MHNLYTLKNGLRVVTEKISESNFCWSYYT